MRVCHKRERNIWTNLDFLWYFDVTINHRYSPFRIVSNSHYLWKSGTLVGSIVNCYNKFILGYNWWQPNIVTRNKVAKLMTALTVRRILNNRTSYNRTWRQPNKKISSPTAFVKQSWAAYTLTFLTIFRFFFCAIDL